MKDDAIEIVTKTKAIELGLIWYFTGKICRNGHKDKRSVKSGVCYACHRIYQREYKKANRDKCNAINKKSYAKHKAKRIAYRNIWTSKNKELVREIRRRNKKKHRVKYLEAQKRKYKENGYFRLCRNISKGI